MHYNVINRTITIFKLSVSFVYLLLLICYSFGVAVTGLDLILFSELFNLIVFPFNELSRSPVLPLGITLLPPKLQRRGLVFLVNWLLWSVYVGLLPPKLQRRGLVFELKLVTVERV